MSQYPGERPAKLGPLIIGVVLLVVGGVLALDAWKSYTESPASPAQVTAAELAGAVSPNALPSKWVTFRPDEIVHTRVSRVEGTRHKKRYYYNLVRVGSHWAVFCSPEPNPKGTLKAIATNFDSDNDRSAAAELYARLPKAKWLSFQFDSAQSPHNASNSLAIVAGLVLLLGAGLTLASLNQRRYVDPMREPPPMPFRPQQHW